MRHSGAGGPEGARRGSPGPPGRPTIGPRGCPGRHGPSQASGAAPAKPPTAGGAATAPARSFFVSPLSISCLAIYDFGFSSPGSRRSVPRRNAGRARGPQGDSKQPGRKAASWFGEKGARARRIEGLKAGRHPERPCLSRLRRAGRRCSTPKAGRGGIHHPCVAEKRQALRVHLARLPPEAKGEPILPMGLGPVKLRWCKRVFAPCRAKRRSV